MFALRGLASRASRADLLFHLALGGLLVGGGMLVEPVLAALWEAKNEGKLFKSIEQDRTAAMRAELAALRALRGHAARAAAAAAEVGPASPDAAVQSPAASATDEQPAAQHCGETAAHSRQPGAAMPSPATATAAGGSTAASAEPRSDPPSGGPAGARSDSSASSKVAAGV